MVAVTAGVVLTKVTWSELPRPGCVTVNGFGCSQLVGESQSWIDPVWFALSEQSVTRHSLTVLLQIGRVAALRSGVISMLLKPIARVMSVSLKTIPLTGSLYTTVNSQFPRGQEVEVEVSVLEIVKGIELPQLLLPDPPVKFRVRL